MIPAMTPVIVGRRSPTIIPEPQKDIGGVAHSMEEVVVMIATKTMAVRRFV